MAHPRVLVVSCTDENPSFLIEKILDVAHLPEGIKVIEDILSFDWKIDTKYYTADVCLCTTECKTIGDQDFADSVEAFIVYFNSKKENSFSSVKQWLPYLKEIEPQSQLLVCETCREDDVNGRLMVQQWCTDNGFELVEMSPDEDSDTEIEDAFQEATGVKRIIEVLKAQTWSNLVLKDNPKICSPYFRQLMQEEAATLHSDNNEHQTNDSGETHVSTNNDNDTLTSDSHVKAQSSSLESSTNSEIVSKDLTDKDSCENADSDLSMDKVDNGASPDVGKSDVKLKESTTSQIDDDSTLFEVVGDEDPGSESFEKLFERLKTMKDEALILPPDERKKYAEKVVVSFWKAMGGDEDEIADLDDSDVEET